MRHFLIGKKNNVIGEINSDLYLNTLNKVAIRESMVTQVWDENNVGHSMELAYYNDEGVYWRYFGIVEKHQICASKRTLQMLIDKGVGAVGIAGELGVPTSVVTKLLKEYGLKTNMKRVSDVDVINMIDNGYSDDEICTMTGLCEKALSMKLRDLRRKAKKGPKKQSFVKLHNKGINKEWIQDLIGLSERSYNTMLNRCVKEGLIKEC